VSVPASSATASTPAPPSTVSHITLFAEHARMGSSGQMCDKCRYGGGKEK
jgi:hypothetical protein